MSTIRDNADPKRMQVAADWAKAYHGANGLQVIANNLSNPVKFTMDTKGIMRNVFAVNTNYAKGMPFLYEKDLQRTPAVVTALGGGVYSVNQSPERVYINEMAIQTRVYVDQSDLYTRTYDVAERAKERLAEGLVIREELLLLALLSAGCNSAVGNPVVATGGALDKATLTRSYKFIEEQNLIVSHVLLSPSGVSGIRRIGWTELDQKGLQETRETGSLGVLYGASFKQSYLIQAGRAYACADGEYLGQYYIRQDNMIQPLNEPHMARLGFAGYLLVGMAIHNAKGAVEIQFNAMA